MTTIAVASMVPVSTPLLDDAFDFNAMIRRDFLRQHTLELFGEDWWDVERELWLLETGRPGSWDPTYRDLPVCRSHRSEMRTRITEEAMTRPRLWIEGVQPRVDTHAANSTVRARGLRARVRDIERRLARLEGP